MQLLVADSKSCNVYAVPLVLGMSMAIGSINIKLSDANLASYFTTNKTFFYFLFKIIGSHKVFRLRGAGVTFIFRLLRVH